MDRLVYEVMEDVGTFTVNILRRGDLSEPSSVKLKSFVNEEPKSASGEYACSCASYGEMIVVFVAVAEKTDFLPIEEMIEFSEGQDKAPVIITIVDDDEQPVLEGVETFYLVLQYPKNATISEPETMKILINDKDLDSMLKFIYFHSNLSVNTCHFFSAQSQATSRYGNRIMF